MNPTHLEVTPLRPAVRTDAPVTLDVLVTVTPPEAPPANRPALNLGLVLDRSGSMSGANKMGYARDAAAFAVQQLRPTDRVSVTIFDDQVETIFPNALAENRGAILAALGGVLPRGSTNLHGGWAEGARQVGEYITEGGLNRVLLLSDGLANQGETNPDTIAGDVRGRKEAGVSTTTLGVGNNYHEELMEAIAKAGDGNYYYIQSPVQLADIFQTELKELVGMVGTRVSLDLEPGEGVRVVELINEFEHGPDGEYLLPNLVSGLPIQVILRLVVPPAAGTADVCRFRFGWDAPRSAERVFRAAELRLPAVDGATWEKLAPDVTVQEQVALLMIARAKRDATARLEEGDRTASGACLAAGREQLRLIRPGTLYSAEVSALAETEELLANGEDAAFAKLAKHQAHRRRSSKPY